MWDSGLTHSDFSPKASSAKDFHGSHLPAPGRREGGVRKGTWRKNKDLGKDVRLICPGLSCTKLTVADLGTEQG